MQIFKSEIKKLAELYDISPAVDEWEKASEPDEDLIYRSGVKSQCDKARSIANLLNMRIVEQP